MTLDSSRSRSRLNQELSNDPRRLDPRVEQDDDLDGRVGT